MILREAVAVKLNEKQWAALGKLTDLPRKPGQIGAAWQTLDALVERGLAAGWWSSTGLVYKITDAGRAALAARGGEHGDVR
mgnify:CR=1 FL=1